MEAEEKNYNRKETYMTIFFTADQHFFHSLLVPDRGFDSIEAMNEAMIESWNVLVQPRDTIYHLGDFTLENPIQACQILRRLNGKIKIVPGGHDHWIDGPFDFQPPFEGKIGLPEHVEILPPLVSIKVPKIESGLGERGSHIVCLCHYPMRTWDRSHYGSWHLHGHSHGKLGIVTGKYSFDVGVDCWQFDPVSLRQVGDAITSPWKYDPTFDAQVPL